MKNSEAKHVYIAFAMKEIVLTLRFCREQVTAQSPTKGEKTQFSVMINYNEHPIKT